MPNIEQLLDLMDIENSLNKLGRIQKNVVLQGYTTFNIGGCVDYFFSPSCEDALNEAVGFLKGEGIDFYVLGGGSNILVSSSGLRGVVINPLFDDMRFQAGSGQIYAGAKVRISRLLNFCLDNSLSGWEFLAGLKATIGGVIANNASFRGNSASQKVKKVKVLDIPQQKIYFLDKQDIQWQYRNASLDKFIILGAVLSVSRGELRQIKGLIKSNIRYRLERQELASLSAGCIFRNPKASLPAGSLIEKAGFKGIKAGGAMISKKHANFILNESCAKSQDVISLIEQIKQKIKEQFGISLIEEIKRWGC